MDPGLGYLAVTDMGGLDTFALQLLASPLGADAEKRCSVLVAGDDIMQCDAGCAPVGAMRAGISTWGIP